MEMADILFVLICMANREGIDLQQAFDRMMAKVESRDRDRWTRKGGSSTGAGIGRAEPHTATLVQLPGPGPRPRIGEGRIPLYALIHSYP